MTARSAGTPLVTGQPPRLCHGVPADVCGQRPHLPEPSSPASLQAVRVVAAKAKERTLDIVSDSYTRTSDVTARALPLTVQGDE